MLRQIFNKTYQIDLSTYVSGAVFMNVPLQNGDRMGQFIRFGTSIGTTPNGTTTNLTATWYPNKAANPTCFATLYFLRPVSTTPENPLDVHVGGTPPMAGQIVMNIEEQGSQSAIAGCGEIDMSLEHDATIGTINVTVIVLG